MGKSDRYGSIYLQIDGACCLSGTMVTGKIFVNIREAFPAGQIKLYIEGKEKCKWYEQRSRTVGHGEHRRIEYYEVKFENKHIIIEYEETMYRFESGYIYPGQYIFPFQFFLPKECPSSAYYTGHSKAEAYIKYKCKTKFKAADNSNIDSIESQCFLLVRQTPGVVQVNLQASERVEIYKC